MLPSLPNVNEAVNDAAESDPDATARGWVVPPGGSRVDAIFVLAGDLLGIGRTSQVAPPVWLELDDVVGLDAIGEVVDGLQEVEIRMRDDKLIGAGWTEPFCDAVVARLRAIAGVDDAEPTPAPEPEPEPALEPEPVLGAEPEAPDVEFVMAPSTSTLDLEDVNYLGGHPEHPKRRKKCAAVLDASGIEVSGPGDFTFRVGWEVVESVEAQNSDEARFRMNTKVHRDASALVVECKQSVTILLEARDCPTVPLRSALIELLRGTSVVVA